MNLQLRFNLILGSLLLGFCVVLLLLNRFANQAETRYQEDYSTEQSIYLQHWLNTDARSWLQEALALAKDPRVLAALDGSASELRKDEDTSTETQLIVLHRDGSVASTSSGFVDATQAGFLQPDSGFIASLKNEGGWFYFTTGSNLFHASYAVVAGAGDTMTKGWVLLIRECNQAQLDYLGRLVGAKLTIATSVPAAATAGSFQLVQRLRDWRGRQVRLLIMEGFPPNPQAAFAEAIIPTFLLLGFGLLVIFALAFSLQRWVLGPLRLVEQSLSSGEITPIEPLQGRRDELGGVAALLATSIAQRKALHESEANLQNALEERIRLGRDLHDSVIQSLYATGMGLAVVKGRLTPDQSDVAAKLEQSRAALNETILDLRNFITGLEPKALKQQTFTQVVTHLLDFTSDMRPVKTACEIDDGLAERLSISQRANILQITREALSNALRHGEATEIAVTLRATGDKAEFEIRDNGRGFDPGSQQVNGGHGLENLAGRARDIGARLTFNSQPGQGTVMKLTFALPKTTT